MRSTWARVYWAACAKWQKDDRCRKHGAPFPLVRILSSGFSRSASFHRFVVSCCIQCSLNQFHLDQVPSSFVSVYLILVLFLTELIYSFIYLYIYLFEYLFLIIYFACFYSSTLLELVYLFVVLSCIYSLNVCFVLFFVVWF